MGVGGQCHAPAAVLQDPVPTVQEAGWTPGLVWVGAKNVAPTGISRTIQTLASCYTDYTIPVYW